MYKFFRTEQGDLLKTKTDGLLLGKMVQSRNDDIYLYQFVIVAPKLDNYRYVLFKAIAGIYAYPVFIYDREQCNEAIWSLFACDIERYYEQFDCPETDVLDLASGKTIRLFAPTYRVEDIKQFEQSFAKILNSNFTKKVIEALLQKSQSVFS
jgi:hypothetical protein